VRDRIGQRHEPAAAQQVAGVLRPHATGLFRERPDEGPRHHDETVLIALPAAHDDLPAVEV
jgi:hypothetical protein